MIMKCVVASVVLAIAMISAYAAADDLLPFASDSSQAARLEVSQRDLRRESLPLPSVPALLTGRL
jgi:hypothetical protein